MSETLVPPSRELEDPVARGRAARSKAPRRAHGAPDATADRPDPLALLAEEDRTRVPELVPIRYGRMAASPFAFFRGAAAIMASDLARVPATGIGVQLCGDAHLMNFGFYTAPDRRLVFDINDFDETAPGPFEWDVKRLAASFAVAGRSIGLRQGERAEVVRTVAERYRRAIRRFAAMRHVDVFYARADIDLLERDAARRLSAERAQFFLRNVAKARAKDHLRALAKLTEDVDGVARIRSDPPLVVRIDDLLPPGVAGDLGVWLRALIDEYAETLPTPSQRLIERYRAVDLARKVVGVGSVGTRAWIVLLLGRHEQDGLVMQVKEAEASVLEPYTDGAGVAANHGRRVVEGQRLMQATSDVLLGWLRTTGIDGETRDFYVRQLWDGKGSAVVETMKARDLALYGRACAWTLARAHARTGDAAEIGGYLGRGDTFDRSMVSFAEGYAEQNERDHSRLVEAIAAGRTEARDEG